VGRGLAAAHDRGMIHRDLNPENPFVTKDGIVTILDFGLARLERGSLENPPTQSEITARIRARCR
jgi:serine/threonine protein kinase